MFDDGAQRLLSFGPEDEQSACLKGQPAQLVFEYLQAMCLCLAWTTPKKALLLGLGAGALVHSLQHFDKGIKIQAVELRQSVIDAAYDYFYLPRSKRVQVHCAEALSFMQQNTERFDLVMSDLFTERGVLEQQFTPGTLRAYQEALKAEGTLVINCWRMHQFESAWLHLIQALFAHVYGCTTRDGNWILFARQSPVELTRAGVEKLERHLAFPLLPALKHFQSLRD